MLSTFSSLLLLWRYKKVDPMARNANCIRAEEAGWEVVARQLKVVEHPTSSATGCGSPDRMSGSREVTGRDKVAPASQAIISAFHSFAGAC